MGSRFAAIVLTAALTAATSLTLPAAEVLTPAEWLLDLGRDYPLSPQAGLSDADATITLLFMQAASRLDAAQPEPYLWQYDMLSALGRDREAREALLAYVQKQPDDVAAWLQWVDMSLDPLQSLEERAEWLKGRLEEGRLPSEVTSDLHRRLAELHLNRGDRETAGGEAREALTTFPQNLAAKALLLRLGNDPAPAELLKLDLEILAARPADVGLALRIADQFAAAEQPAVALRLAEHAVAVAELAGPAESLAAAHDLAGWLAARAGDSKSAADHTAKAAAVYKHLLAQPPQALAAPILAEIAWFFARQDATQAAQAEKLARTALLEADLPTARLALGTALGRLGQTEPARQELSKIAGSDSAAALELARLDEAARPALLRSAATRPADARTLAGFIELGASRPVDAEIRPLPQAIPWATLDFPLHPEKYMSLTCAMPSPQMEPGRPWLLSATLRNTGSFPITLGEGFMVVPDLLLAVQTDGDVQRTSGPVLRLSFNKAGRLMPGEQIGIRRSILVGPIRSAMIGTPQVEHQATVTGVLSPVAALDEAGHPFWQPSPGGLVVPPVKFRRTALTASTERVKSLIDLPGSAAVDSRIEATELLAQLLAESQHLAAGRLRYSARSIEAPRVQAALLARARDPDALVRARLAECLRWVVLDRQAEQTAVGLLSDENWLVRGLAMRTMADQRRARFAETLIRGRDGDPDPWVQELCRALLDRGWPAPATRPQ